MPKRTCSAPDCERSHYSRGFCQSHYRKARAARPDAPVCSESPCDRVVYARQKCRRHYCDEVLPGYWDRSGDNGDVHRALGRAYYAANRERLLARQREWIKANPGYYTPHGRRWRAANIERARQHCNEHHQRRRAQIRGTQVEPVDFAVILTEHGMVCHLCGGGIEPGDLHFDHVIPLARGGTHTYDNIRPAHAGCNLRKGCRID